MFAHMCTSRICHSSVNRNKCGYLRWWLPNRV